MTETATSRSTHVEQRNALALIITNAYRARHGMPKVTRHASVDEDIAEAIINAGWTAPEEMPATEHADKIAMLNESLNTGVGSKTSRRAKHIRDLAEQVMEEHSDWTDRNDEHKMLCLHDNTPWPCPEYSTAWSAYMNAGGSLGHWAEAHANGEEPTEEPPF